MEIRQGTAYGIWPVVGNGGNYYVAITNSMDTNDRQTSRSAWLASTAVAEPGIAQLTDLGTFTVSDGRTSVTFQFVTNALLASKGNFPIVYDGTEEDCDTVNVDTTTNPPTTTVVPGMASKIAAAINASGLHVTASVSGALSTSIGVNEVRVNLFGATMATVPISVRKGSTLVDGCAFSINDGSTTTTFTFWNVPAKRQKIRFCSRSPTM